MNIKYNILRTVVMAAAGAILGMAGVTIHDWKFWAMLCLFTIYGGLFNK
jgi:hypothetical protein